jgi:predicted kinase
MIIVVTGLPGVGKTTFSKELGSILNAQVLSSDKIRKELFSKPTYSKSEKSLVYEVILLIAKYLHQTGKTCILDATFSRENFRKKLQEKLDAKKNQLFLIECKCPEPIVLKRLRNRKNDYSDADFRIYKKLKRQYEPIKTSHITIDTGTLSAKKAAQITIKEIFKK